MFSQGPGAPETDQQASQTGNYLKTFKNKDLMLKFGSIKFYAWAIIFSVNVT